MYADYEQARIKNAINEAKIAQAQAEKTQADCGSGVIGSAVGRPYTLSEQLERSAAGSHQQANDYSRASSILRAHPEFEDLIWLIRSGLI